MLHHQYQRREPNTKLQSQGQLQQILRFKFNATATAKSHLGSSGPTLKLVRRTLLCAMDLVLRKENKELINR